jgi:hypothetical protein
MHILFYLIKSILHIGSYVSPIDLQYLETFEYNILRNNNKKIRERERGNIVVLNMLTTLALICYDFKKPSRDLTWDHVIFMLLQVFFFFDRVKFILMFCG